MSLLDEIFLSLAKTLIFFGVILTGAAYATLGERKFSAFFQNRRGPNRAGPSGLLQPLADGIKFIFKEEIIPTSVDRAFYLIGPALMVIVALIPWAAIPFGDRLVISGVEIPIQIADLNVGILFMLSVSSLGVYGIILGGWASNNKFSLLGAVRSSAQMISYELTLGLSLSAVFLITGGVGTREIIMRQIESPWHWNIFIQPVGFIIFFISMLAETNRNPFDLAEAESELLVGYHTEYGAFKFALYMISEYINIITASAIITLVYFGGWSIPFVNLNNLGLSVNLTGILTVMIFLAKTTFFVFVFIWIRWTLPRFRYDQLMNLGWKVLLPLALINLVVTAAVALVA